MPARKPLRVRTQTLPAPKTPHGRPGALPEPSRAGPQTTPEPTDFNKRGSLPAFIEKRENQAPRGSTTNPPHGPPEDPPGHPQKPKVAQEGRPRSPKSHRDDHRS